MSFTTATSIVYNDLKSYPDLTTKLSRGEKGINPLIASEQEENNFVNYFVEDNGPDTKDLVRRWEVVVQSFSSNYDLCCEIADEVTNAFKNATSIYKELGGKPSQTEDGWLYIEQRFNIKI